MKALIRLLVIAAEDKDIIALLNSSGFIKGKKTNEHLLKNAMTYQKDKYMLYYGPDQNNVVGWFLYEKTPSGGEKWLTMGTSALTLKRALIKFKIT